MGAPSKGNAIQAKQTENTDVTVDAIKPPEESKCAIF